MPDVFKVADLLVSHAVKTHGQEIDIIAYSGSYAQGTAKRGSDLDIFYIPTEGKTPPAARTFLLDGILFDFWAIPWERMEGFATGTFRGWSVAPSLVHHAKVLHARSEQDAKRFAGLRQTVLDLQKPEAKPQMLQRAMDRFKNVMMHVGNLRLAVADGNLGDARHCGWRTITDAWECLALANQVLLDRGLGHIVEQIPMIQSRPPDLEELITIIATSNDANQISSAAERLATNTRKVLREFQKSIAPQGRDAGIPEINYPELSDMIGKVISACDRRESVAASAAAWFLQADLSEMLHDAMSGPKHRDFNLYSEFASEYYALGLPDLMEAGIEDPTVLARRTRLLDERIRQWFAERSVGLEEYRTLDDFRQSL